jgi:protoheme IX farnesyltransferase
MQTSKSYLLAFSGFVKAKTFDYYLLVKFRLTFIVVFSSLITYAIAAGASFSYENLTILFLGGFLITGAANALNQVFEKDVDRLMNRTANRPLAQDRMTPTEAILAAGVFGLSGVSLLWYWFNDLAAIIGALSLITYSFIYTPLKRISSVAVFVGAIPGALPPMIGWVAATGQISIEAYIITAIQFLWQFPHFWAIAWVAHEDYTRAGFKLMPSSAGRDRFSATQIVLYTIALIPVSVLLYFKGNITPFATVIIAASGFMFLYYGIKLWKSCEINDAKKVMFASFIYLPVVLLALLLGGKF